MKERLRLIITPLLFSMILTGCGPVPSEQVSTSEESNPISSEVVNPNYTNPVFEPVLADPSIIRGDDGIFYAYGTQDNALWGEYYGVKYGPILSSPDLVNWTYEDAVFKVSTLPNWGTLGAGIWAPDVIKLGDKYLYYYSLSTWGDPDPGIGVASSNAPLGPWTDHGKVFTSSEVGVGNSIDAAVVVEDGRVFMAWGSFIGIYAIELTADGLGLLNPATAKTDKILLAGIDNGRWDINNHEGVYFKKINGYYYMFLSTGTCCQGLNSSYRVLVARSENLLGPYVDHNNLAMANAQNRGSPVVSGNERFVGVGHNSIIEDDAGDYWILYHGFDTTKEAQYGTTNRRTLLIDKLEWTNDGWPYVQNQGASSSATKPYINL